MKTVTSEQMRVLERQAVEEFGVTTLTLMENAGRGAAELILDLTKDKALRTKERKSVSASYVLSPFPRVLIVCGKGNNGGDGFVIARYLAAAGTKVTVALLCNPEDLKGDARINFERLGSLDCFVGHWPPRNDDPTKVSTDSSVIATHSTVAQGGELDESSDQRERSNLAFCTQIDSAVALPRKDEKTDLIVDAILGTGLKSNVTGIYKEAIDWINQSGKPVIAVDIPSGLDADTGEIRGVCVKADLTATMGFAKDGMLKGEGPKVCGEIHVIDIGLPMH